MHFSSRQKRAIPVIAILQAGAAIGGTLIKGINALVDAKRAKSFNNALKMVAANVELKHQRLMKQNCKYKSETNFAIQNDANGSS